MATTRSWVLECACCCGDEQVHVEYDGTRMRCATCGCARPQTSATSELAVRIMVRGNLTVSSIEKALLLARTLGANDDASLGRTSPLEHYFDVPAEGITTKLQIAEITRAR